MNGHKEQKGKAPYSLDFGTEMEIDGPLHTKGQSSQPTVNE
jgi:hypothetical protein